MTSKEHLIWETHKRRNLWKAAQSCAYQAPSGQVARWDLLQLHLIENALYCIYTTSSTKLLCILRYWLQCIFLLHFAFSVLHLPKSDAEYGAFLVICVSYKWILYLSHVVLCIFLLHSVSLVWCWWSTTRWRGTASFEIRSCLPCLLSPLSHPCLSLLPPR